MLPEGRLRKLKEEIALGDYRVDAGAVADEILKKLSLIKRARADLEAHAADRNRSGDARRRPRR